MDYLIVLFLFLALIAEILGTVGGFGSSLLFVPIAAFFFDFNAVLGITAIFHLSSNISKIALFKKGVRKDLIIKIGVPSVILVIVGAILSKYVKGHWFEFLLGCVLTILSIFLLIKTNYTILPSSKNCLLGGGISGFVAGLLGTGGAIRGITLAAFNLEKNVFIATSAVIDLGVDASRSIIYAYNGYIQQKYLYLVPLLLVVSILGTYIGKHLLDFISETVFKKIVLLLVLLVGLVTIFKTVYNNPFLVDF